MLTIMETMKERNTRLSQDVYDKYDSYFRAYRKAIRNKSDTFLQQEMEIKKQEWLKAIEAKKKG
jgi:hypothetical protein